MAVTLAVSACFFTRLLARRNKDFPFSLLPNEINIFEDIQWDESSMNSLIPIAGNLFLEYHPKDQELEPRETMEQFKGMREVSKSLQQEGYTGTQALQILKQFQKYG